MTNIELQNLVNNIDPKNTEYILANQDVISKFESLNHWENKDRTCLAVLEKEEDQDKRCRSIAEMVRRELEEAIRQFDSIYLTPANAKAGDGATVNLYSDRHEAPIFRQREP